MYVIPKEDMIVRSIYKIPIHLKLSQTWKVKQTSGCKPGEYALFKKADEDKGTKFSIFGGYITYDNICEWFEMIKYGSIKE